ncbi:MAG TPA: 16S rRNA (uracil(1498)-N(3))-methyltransferase [Xanthomonadales bacterium]
MRQSRIHTSQPLAVANSVELTGSASHYMARVLRLSKGDNVVLFNGDGVDYFAEISEIHSQRVLLSITDSRPAANESPLKITLVQAVCRGERMDYVIQKATELGVVCIQPLISQRVEVRLDAARQSKRMTHWQGVATSACEQSGRARVPEVNAPLSLAQWLTSARESACLVLDPFAENRLSGISIRGDSISILIGPEGGFTEEEIKALRAKGLIAVSLGPRVLRTETAGPAAIAVLQAKMGDF